MKKIQKILVTTDLSSLSLAATICAKTLAKATRAKLCLVYVAEDPVIVGEPTIDVTYANLWPKIEEIATKNLKEFASKNLRGVPNVTVQLLQGNPYAEIIRFAQNKRFDLIVMATHGRTGLAHVLLGSVAERVMRHSPVPVLLVKPAKMLKEIIRPRKRIRR